MTNEQLAVLIDQVLYQIKDEKRKLYNTLSEYEDLTTDEKNIFGGEYKNVSVLDGMDAVVRRLEKYRSVLSDSDSDSNPPY